MLLWPSFSVFAFFALLYTAFADQEDWYERTVFRITPNPSIPCPDSSCMAALVYIAYNDNLQEKLCALWGTSMHYHIRRSVELFFLVKPK